MKKCIIILLLVSNIILSYSQNQDEVKLLREHCCDHDGSNERKRISDAGTGIVSRLFFIYKSYISTQDNHSCVFTPSCSEYAVQSIQKQGLIPGTFDTLDRLTRCHGLRPQEYPIDPASRRLSDPVKNIRNEKL